MKHKILVLVLAMLLVVCAAAQFVMPTAALAAELPTFGTTTSTDGYNMWTGKPTGFSGRATVNLYFESDTFPGEPRYISDENYSTNYIRYDNTFTKSNSGYFVVNEILQDNFRNTSDFVLGSNLTFLLVWSATSGIFDPSGVDRYFTDDFKQALEFYEDQMISDVLAAKLADGQVVSNTNIDDYEIVWYVIKYQRIGETWYVNGLIREKDKYSVTYDGNGNTAGSPPDGRVNMSYTEARNYYVASHISTDDSGEDTSLALDNYTFTGWNTKPDGTGVFFEAEKHADLTGLTDTNGEPLTAIVLYAQWKQDSKYTVTWLNDDDSIIHLDANLSKNASVTYDGATPNKAPDSEHIYVFDGWATSKNGTNLGITPTVTVKNNMTMYPLFRAEERTYTVTWVNNTVIRTDSGIGYGDTISYVGEVPTRSTTETEDYIFDGWAESETGDVVYALRDNITVNGDITLYAHFTLVPMRTVTWYNEDGSAVLATQKALQGASVSYNGIAPTKTGADFVGWSSSVGGSLTLAPSAAVTVNGNMSFYALFETKKFEVVWKNHDGNVLKTETLTYGTMPAYSGTTPVKTSTAEFSYTHTGWTPALAAVTDAAEYTAVFTPVKRSYTITWKNYDNTVLKTESVEYGTTPTYTGGDPVHIESATHTFLFKGWDNEPVPVVGDATYIAVYEEIDKKFTATVKVLENPDIDSVTGAVSGGTPTDLDELTEYDALWLRDVEDHSKLYPMSRKEAGVYTAELIHGSYDVVVKKGEIYDRIITERIVLPAEMVAGDPDTTAADIIFFSVTYDFDSGSYDGKNSIVKYYQRGADVIIDDITPAREFYQFNNWQLDSGSDIYFSDQRITVLGMGIIKPHTITARWQRSNDKVIVNLTVKHHSDPAVSLAIGINPAAGLAPIHIDLTGKAAGSDDDYVQAGRSYVLAADWITPENTVDTETPANGLEYNTKISTLSFAADVTDFQGLSSALDYSANIRLEDYFLTDRTVTASEPDANGDITYTVNATLQYRPDLFTMHYTVQIDDSVPDVLIPAVVDIKILSYKDGEWSPISRHTNSSFEARFDGTESVSGSYSVPMDYLYRVSVFGFTLADDTELFAENGLIELVDYTSKATSASATYKYAAGAYTAVVTVTSDQTAADGSKGIYGVADGTGYKQADGVSVLVNVFANAHSVTFDPNGGKLNGSTEALEVENQFRIPVLGSYIPTRDDGYVFDGWQLNGSPAVIGEVITEDITLIAKWKAPLTVSGEIRISTKDSDGNTILFEGLPISLIVTLERTAPSGDQFIVQSKTYALDESNYTSGVGILAYEFTPVPQDGSSYRIYVNVTNYQTAFMNEPASGSVSASVLNDPANYVGSREALDNNADNAAHVYAYLIFDPEEFPLTWEIDASSIASAYRPESLDMLVRFNSENDVSTAFYDWGIIVQHFDGSTYSPENTVIASDGKAIDSYPVWNVHPQGYAFDYALKLHQWEKGGLKYDLTESTPFTATFAPAIAWYNGTRQVTTDPLQDNLKVTLSPKSYKINYELNAGSDEVSGMTTAPENHIWSYATEVPTALIRHGYDFLGWTCDVAGAYADGVISADTASDITLTANWSKQKAVTFRIANGTWQGGSAADIVRYVSLTDNSADIRDIIPTGMNAAYGYHNGSWNDAALNAGGTAPIIVSGSDAITYVYSFERQYHNVSFDANGDGIAESIDSVAHGNYIRITPVNGIWQGSSAEQDIRIESDLQLVNPTRENYIFAGWNRHFIDDSASHPGSVVRHNYMAAWLYDENGDNVPDNLQKKVIFNVANGTWDGVNYAPIIKFATLNAENEADISSLVPTGMQPRAGFLTQDAFWSPDVLSNSIVHGNGVVSYTYNHYTTITYADALNEGNTEQLMILPGSYVSIDPAGGVWDESLSATIIQINGAYVLQAPEYTNHDFLGWKISAGTGGVAHVFTAEWKKDSYTIIWQNADGTELEKDENVEFGTMPSYDGEAPVKASDAQYHYEFLGWTPAVKLADAPAVYKAEYTPVLRSYTVTWLDWDDSVLDTDILEYGQLPSYAGTPQRTNTAQYSYSFTGWDKTIETVTGDVSYKAVYTETVNEYNITWLDEGDTELQSGKVAYGTMPTAPADPTKPATPQYTYDFIGWTPAVESVSGDAVYRAVYAQTVNKYTVTWYAENGSTVLKEEDVEFGTAPVPPADPEKAATAQYTYVFSGWKSGSTVYNSSSIPVVEGAVSYTAQFAETVNRYTVTWLNFNNIQLEQDTLVEYGSVPQFDSSSKLTKEDENSDYEFLGWYVSDDSSKTVINLAAQTVTKDITYIAKYNVTPKARKATINVWLNATDAFGAGGTLADIATVTNGERTNIYLVPLGMEADSSKFILTARDAAGAYTASVLPGTYSIYAGKTAATAIPEAEQKINIVNSDETVHTLYNSIVYQAGEGSFADSSKSFTKYYKSGFGPIDVEKTIPALSGKVFTHWHDAEENVFNASTDAVPVKLTEQIIQGYVLTAHWADAKDITVVVNIKTVSENSFTDSDISSKVLNLQLTGSSTVDGSYADIYGTNKSAAFAEWTSTGENSYQYTTTYSNHRGDYFYQATALLKNYMRESISVSGNTVTIDLVYDPAGFDLSFDVIVDSSVPDELAPIAVDVQLVFYDRHNDEWSIVPGFESRTIEVALSKVDGVWQGTGTYHVWSKYTTAPYEDQLYLYRIAITGFELGPVRGSLSAVNSDGGNAFKVYKSQAGTYHPAAAYIANVSVSDSSCMMGTAAGLNGAHVYRNGSVDEQHGSITATISIDPYTVVQHYEDGVTADKITSKVFLTPFLDEPVRSGYIFDGWWTKDAHGNWDSKVSSAGLAIMDLVANGKTLDLYAKWKQDLTVCGDVQIFNWYMHNGNKTFIFDHDRIDTAIVRLVRSNGGSQTVLRVQEVSMTDVIGAGETAETADHRLGSFSFENVPDDGSEYHITIAATNFTSKFRNETVASGAAFSETLNAAVDKNGDSTARVDAQMTFAPAVFDLIFTVDADAIAEGFRPDSVGLVIRGNDRLPSETQTEPLSWPIISQQKQGSNVLSHAIAMDKNTGLPVEDAHGAGSGIWHDFEVWQAHPANYFYAYALEVWDAAFGSTVYDQSNMANAPFTVAYVPVRAWYDIASGEQTVPPTVLDLGITLTHPDSSKPNGLVAYMLPKTYDLTFELGRTGSVAGITKLDADTFLDSFTWSFGKASLPTAEAEGEAGVSFGGWWTKNGRSTGDWGEQITSIPANQQGDLTLYARWIYTVTWNCANGSSPIVETLIEGTMPVEPLSPTKPATTQYTYSFTGWSPAISKVSGNSTYTAQYSSTVNSYTITWKNGSETLATDTVAYGGTPVYSGSTPKKDSTAEFSYEFIGWTPAISSVTGDAEYSAVFSATKRSYTITWLNADSTLLDADSNVLYGEQPVYSSVHPQKAGDAQYSYSFIGWQRAGDSNIYDAVSIPVVEGDTVYTAQYEQSINKYTVIWQNYDGTELEKDENVPYGTMPSYDAAAPSRASTAQYAYHFKSWDKMPEPVSGNVTYTAEYYQQTQTYTVIWENADGTELERDTNVPYGAVPAYNGTVPVKAEDAQYSYSFDKWSPAISAVTADAVYTAEYKSTVRKYRITWLDENDSVLRSEMLEYGITPAYGTPPAKAADAQYTYSFDKWSPDIVSVTGEASYKASYIATVNEYTVIWQNYDGTELEKDENVPYGTTPTYDGATPTKAATAQYSYSFAGWTPAIHSLTGDVVYTAAFSETVNEYVITWYDEDGITKLDEQTLPFGAVPVYKGSAPQKAGDAQFSYTFNGWDSAFAPVSGNASYQASYQQHLNSYKVTWLNENGIVLETDENVPYGTAPTYDGATPTKAATAQYTYSFDKWSPDVSAVTGDAVYSAVYASTVNEYTVIWYDEDGVTKLDEQTLPFGADPVYAGLTPTKASTAQYSYSFSHWTPAVSSVSGNAHYIASYHSTVNTYTVIWQDEDGTELEKDENVPYGTAPEFNGATPTKPATAQFTYSFKGWSPSTSDVTGDAIYKAEYNTTVNKYTVKWMNEGSSTPLEVDNDIPYGAMPVYNGAVPTKAATAEYTFTFKGWSPAIAAVETDAVYVAEFTAEKNKYHVVWKDSDGTILETDYDVEYGTVPGYDGATPTKAADAQYSYSFAGWTPSVSAVDGHEEYTASYSSTLRSYEVRWVNYDGTILETDYNVLYGTTPEFNGATPTRPDHAGESFNFIGWDKPLEAVKGPVVYQAKYEGNDIPYTITWVVEGVSTDETYFYGAMPMYPGSTPQKASTAEFDYVFTGWTPSIVSVTENKTYTAAFDENKRSYLITWLNEDNTLLKSENVEYGTMPTAPADPTKAADAQYSYSFAGWDNAPVAVSGNATYKATYNSILNKYDVVWKNWDGTTLETDADIEYGTVPVYDGTTPTRPATTQYVYTFDKWSPAVSSVTGDVVYTAAFKADLQKYTIIWYDEDGSTVLDSQEVEYGSTPVYGGAQPTKAPTAQYTYSFNKWLPGIASVTGDASYTASYSAEVNKYTVTWKNADGSDLEVDSNVPYGAAPEYNGADPTKASDAQYSYEFKEWTPAVSAVIGNVEYKASYTPTLRSYSIVWKNWDGSMLDADVADYGTVPSYAGSTPQRAGDAQFSYNFKGWTPAVVSVTGDAEYLAEYDASVNEYTVKWVNWDNTPLETDHNVPYGTIPTYDGAAPTRPDTVEHIFTWNLWDKTVSAVTGDITYKAVFVDSANTYTIVWKNYDGAVLKTDLNVPYGAVPSYTGSTPQKPGNAQYNYSFKGWTPAITAVAGNAEYQAVFDENLNNFSITYTDGVDNAVIFPDQQYVRAYGENTPVFIGVPSRDGYSFRGWTPDVADKVTSTAVYAAVWQVASSVIFPPEVLTGTAELVKVDADDVNTRLANVSFELYHANGAYVGSYKTAADGRITVRDLDPGEYYWVETLPAEGYLLDSSKHSFYVEKDKTTSMTVTNTHSQVPSAFSNKHYAYIIGYADGMVRPEDNITRAEVATIFFRLLSEEERARYMTDENQFTDVQEGMWFNRAVSTISAMGIINGYPDHTFRPGAYITRAEFAALAARFDVNGKTTGDFFFDIEGHWAEDEIKTTANNGWILGYEDKSFRPDRHITRAEAMALVNRLLQRVPETKSDLLEDMSVWNDNMDSEKWYYLAVQEATHSHEYVRKSNGHETWTELLKNPDWTALER